MLSITSVDFGISCDVKVTRVITDCAEHAGPWPAVPQAPAGLGRHSRHLYSQLRSLTQGCVRAQLQVAAARQTQQARTSRLRRQHQRHPHVDHTGQ